MRRWLMVLLLAALVMASTPVAAQSELDAARERAEAAAKAADDARDAAADAQARANDLARLLEEAVHDAEDVDHQIAAVESRARAAARERDLLKDDVEDLLVLQYIHVERADAEWIGDGSPELQVRANALARFATFGVGDDVDRYRIVTDDLAAAEEELVALRADLETAVGELEDRNERLALELDEINRQLEIASEREEEYQTEVARLEEEERRRLEEERRRREEERRRLEEKRLAEQRAAEAEAARIAAEAAAATSTTTTTTTTSPPTTVPDAEAGQGGTEDGTGEDGTGTTDDAGSSPDSTQSDNPESDSPESDSPEPAADAGEDTPSGWLCPVGGPTSFFDTFGAARGGGRRHKGVDMFAARGTPVVTPVSGTVRHRRNSLGGLAFYLDGDDGNRYYGAHLDSFGQDGYLPAGSVVGTVGNTGNARYTSPHLHFEIMPGGGASVNPTPTVRAACQ